MTLYHGTSRASADRLLSGDPVDLGRAAVQADFGPGFYMTSSLPQARGWAAESRYTDDPAVITVEIDVTALAQLRVRAFAMAWPEDFNQFWALVRWCRSRRRARVAEHTSALFDAIIGPVAGLPLNRNQTKVGMDQVCWLTEDALALVNGRFSEVPFLP